MLAAAEKALLTRLREHRDIKGVVRTVDTLPKVTSDALLKRYYADAPALYIVPGRFSVADSLATLRFTVAGVVRNVAGAAQARNGDGIDIGCDHLVTLAIRALHDQMVGDCSWRVVSGEMVDEEIFDQAGVAAVELQLESWPVEIGFDYGAGQIAELASFTRVHADIDIPPQAGSAEHAKWLATPPDFSTSRPDAELDAQLPGAR
ncbi:MAG: hypothetical protein B7Y42_00535 [Polaromonas sp. 28-63-22]|jgi:hypothetical protein|nr:MAG: hypothetical protein B7Y42_00535 [Polaromonas sp. 28-63-22]